MAATIITMSQETRKLLEGLKTDGATYDGLVRGWIVAHPTQLTMAELARRIREGRPRPVEAGVALGARGPAGGCLSAVRRRAVRREIARTAVSIGAVSYGARQR
jgi:hypothetical protein